MVNVPQRADVGRALAHLAIGAPLPGDPDPIGSMRAFVRRYGDVEPRTPMADVAVIPLSTAAFCGEWLVAPGADTTRRLVYLHGGGWVAGDLESHRPIAGALARMAGRAVLLVDYRLAPEQPFPAGYNDCEMALHWAHENGPEGPVPATTVALAGDSAGANLAAAVALAACGAGAGPERLVLICSALDGTVAAGPAGTDNAPDAAGLAAMMQLYAQGATPLADPRISPLLAGDHAFALLPPTLLQASASEYLLGQSQQFAARLAANNVRSILSIWPDMPHVWHAFLTLLPEAHAALAEVAAFLRD
jgi:epsilon-lactone hydrolase